MTRDRGSGAGDRGSGAGDEKAGDRGAGAGASPIDADCDVSSHGWKYIVSLKEPFNVTFPTRF